MVMHNNIHTQLWAFILCTASLSTLQACVKDELYTTHHMPTGSSIAVTNDYHQQENTLCGLQPTIAKLNELEKKVSNLEQDFILESVIDSFKNSVTVTTNFRTEENIKEQDNEKQSFTIQHDRITTIVPTAIAQFNHEITRLHRYGSCKTNLQLRTIRSNIKVLKQGMCTMNKIHPD